MRATVISLLALVARITAQYTNSNAQEVYPQSPTAVAYAVSASSPTWTLAPSFTSPIDIPEPSLRTSIPPNASINASSFGNPNSSLTSPSTSPDILADVASDSIVRNPETCHQLNGIAIGWSLPTNIDIKDIQARFAPGTTPCTYGTYVHITSTHDYGTAAMRAAYLAAADAGAILSLSLQPFIPFKHVSAERIAEEMNALLAMKPKHEGGVIWLRFAHEMNWYIDTNRVHHGPTHYHGTTEEFETLWRNIASRVDRKRVKMFWSPNIQVPPDTLADVGKKWWPGAEYVDIVGLDVYPQSRAVTFDFAFGEFYDMYARRYGLPMQLAETGWLGGGTVEEKLYWWGEVTKPEARERCPGYIGFTWFEYSKKGEGDFRIVDLVGGGGKEAGEESSEDSIDIGGE